MLKTKIQQITDQTAQVKQEIADALTAQAPLTKGMWFTIMLSQIEDGILTATYYDTGYQLRQLADYATANAERSLQTIRNTFSCIVDTGRSQAIPCITIFNKKTRRALRGLL